MRHGQQAPLRTSLTPYTGRGWSMVRSRSDIYTRPLPLYIPSEVTWFHGEIPRLKHPLSPPLPFCLFSFFSSCCPSFYLPFVLFLSVSASPLLSALFSLFYLLLLSCFISFHFFLSHHLVYLHSPSLFPLRSFCVWYRLFLQLDEDNVRDLCLWRDPFVFQRTFA